MKEVILEGSPYERGLIHGTKFRKEISRITQVERETLQYRASLQTLDDMLDSCLAYLNDYAPHLIDEIKGIAQGANVRFNDLLLLNYTLEFTDLFSDTLHESLLSALGCTSFAVRTEQGKTLIAQNYDWRLYPIIVLRIRSLDAPEVVCLTIPGMVGCVGMNNAGIGTVINKLTPKDSRMGIAYPFILRKILEADDIVSALTAITRAHRASGLSYIIANSGGDIFCLETSATDFEMYLFSKDYTAHTNHYLHPRLLEYDAGVHNTREMSSYVRLHRMNRLLEEHNDQLTPEVLQELLSDHVGYPESICSHPRPEMAAGTIASVIMDLGKQIMWIANGNPCEKEFCTKAFS